MKRVQELMTGHVPREVAFPQSEYQSRIAKVHKAMESRDLDALLVTHTPNLCYLTGYQSPLANWYTCLVLPRQGEPSVHLVDIELANLLVHGWRNRNIVTFRWFQSVEAPRQLAKIVKEHGLAEKRIGLEMRLGGCTAHLYEQLRQLLPKAKFEDGSDIVLDIRAVKSPAEITHMRKAARFTDIGMQAALQVVGLGKTENDVARVAYDAMIGAGSEYLSIEPLIVAGFAMTLTGHLMFKRRVFESGDQVGLELAGVCHRYSAPLYRTAVIGRPSPLVQRLARASLTALQLVLENARPGRTAHEVARAASKGFRPVAGEGYFQGAYGYAVGIGFPPDWVEHSIYIHEGNERVLETGMVFHSPMGLRIPGKAGVSYSETWVVTETGCETLSTTPRELVVIG
jgi:Xaa-Pro aminopeptidase